MAAMSVSMLVKALVVAHTLEYASRVALAIISH